jgi:hypothetical protein
MSLTICIQSAQLGAHSGLAAAYNLFIALSRVRKLLSLPCDTSTRRFYRRYGKIALPSCVAASAGG